jgi:hypothetical protein
VSINDRRPHFGIGAATKIDRIEITWPNGEQQTLTDVEPNQFQRTALPPMIRFRDRPT